MDSAELDALIRIAEALERIAERLEQVSGEDFGRVIRTQNVPY